MVKRYTFSGITPIYVREDRQHRLLVELGPGGGSSSIATLDNVITHQEDRGSGQALTGDLPTVFALVPQFRHQTNIGGRQ